MFTDVLQAKDEMVLFQMFRNCTKIPRTVGQSFCISACHKLCPPPKKKKEKRIKMCPFDDRVHFEPRNRLPPLRRPDYIFSRNKQGPGRSLRFVFPSCKLITLLDALWSDKDTATQRSGGGISAKVRQ